jgi:hypothetical protein
VFKIGTRTNSTSNAFTVIFDEPVSGFELSDVLFAAGGTGAVLSSLQIGLELFFFFFGAFE